MARNLHKLTPAALANYLVAAILVLVPFHAFLTVWASTFVGHFVLLRLWDEALLVLLVFVVGTWFVRDRGLRRELAASLIGRLIGLYALFVVILGLLGFATHQVTAEALGYALIIHLRFLVWFLAVWLAVRRSAWLRQHWRRLALIPLGLVAVFGIMQFLFLPPDFLKHFGYGPTTFVPYITINQDSTIVRVQSTLRGANPLGAYLALGFTLVTAVLMHAKRRLWCGMLSLATTLALVFTFSRSGWIAATLGAVLLLLYYWRQLRSSPRIAALLIAGAVLLAGSIVFLAADAQTRDFIFHVSDHTTATQTSNEQHASALTQSVGEILREPFGRGPGSSGQPSWYNTGHPIRNTESYLLELGEELGWLGLAIFLALTVLICQELWRRRRDPLSLGLCASLIGLTVTSLVTYSWADDTLAYVWWGLAGIALAQAPQPPDGRIAS